MYYAQRSVEIFRVWEEVLGARERLVRVLAWQSGNTWWMERIVLPHQDAYRHADALAIAPYVSRNVPAQGEGLTAANVADWSLEHVLDHLENTSLPKSIKAIGATKATADAHGLRLLAYEGGQRPRAYGTDLRPVLSGLDRCGRDLLCYFSSVGRSKPDRVLRQALSLEEHSPAVSCGRGLAEESLLRAIAFL